MLVSPAVAMSNLVLRVLTAVVGLPLVAALVLWRQPLGFGALVLLVAGLALTEYAAMTLPTAPRRLRGMIVAVGVALSAGLYLMPGWAIVWVVTAFILTSALVLLNPGDIPAAGARLGFAVFGVFYLGTLSAPLAMLQRDAPHGPAWVLLAVAVTFGNDTGAYFAGKALGRHKLYPAVSPSKTVEGGVGGMVASLAIMLLARAFLAPWLTVGDCLLVALPAGVIGPTGDLVESLIKRAAGAKDSGRLLPGHGGMLDRIDALLFVSAWIYVYVTRIR
jgi:phosphatidate cytidylyltransferase